MDRNVVYNKNVNMVERVIGKEIVLLPVHAQNHEAVYSLNEAGAFVWNLLDGRRDIQTIVSSILDEFEIESKKRVNVCQDVIELLDDLQSVGLIFSE